MLSRERLKIDAQKFSHNAASFIKNQVESAGLRGAVVAVSGGIDSAVTLALTVMGLGRDRVRAITMPERDVTPGEDVNDVMRLADELYVTCDLVDITCLIKELRSTLPLYDPRDLITTGNLKPRVRMTIAYHYANALRSLVVGSSNKTEWMMGYFTKHGDGASDIMPLADLYKTQVRQVAQYLNIPKRIMEKAPSARLWVGQSTEEELGIKFDDLDLILYGMDHGLDAEKLAEETKLAPSVIHQVMDRVKDSEHKRRLPLILRHSSA